MVENQLKISLYLVRNFKSGKQGCGEKKYACKYYVLIISGENLTIQWENMVGMCLVAIGTESFLKSYLTLLSGYNFTNFFYNYFYLNKTHETTQINENSNTM